MKKIIPFLMLALLSACAASQTHKQKTSMEKPSQNTSIQKLLGAMSKSKMGAFENIYQPDSPQYRLDPKAENQASWLMALAYGMKKTGDACRTGTRVPQNDAKASEFYGKAINLYRAAAKLGLVQANVELGQMHSEGRGVPQSQDKAAQFWRSACDAGHPTACNSIAWLRCHDMDSCDEAALADARRAVEFDETNSSRLDTLALALCKRGYESESNSTYRRSCEAGLAEACERVCQ